MPDPDSAFAAVRRLITDSGWRQRVVEQMTPLTANHVELHTSIQVELPEDWGDATTETDGPLVLPIWWFPKRPLLEFSIKDENGPLALLPRRDSAGIVGEILYSEQHDCLGRDALSRATLTAIAASSLGPWEEIGERGGDDADAAVDYVAYGTGHTLARHEAAELLREGRDLTSEAYRIVDLAPLWSTADPDNLAANGLLLVSYANPAHPADNAVVTWIRHHHAAVRGLIEAARSSPSAADFLRLLVTCGVRWPAIVHVWAQRGDSPIIKIRETRPSNDPKVRRFRLDTDTNQAASYHFRAHSPDPTIVIRQVRAYRGPADTDEVGFPDHFEFRRSTEELFTTYTSDPDKVGRVRFVVHYGLRRHVWMPYVFAFALAATALIALLATSTVTAELAAVLAIPPSLVTAVVVSRDAPLTARFLDLPRYALITSTLLLWVVTLWRVTRVG